MSITEFGLASTAAVAIALLVVAGVVRMMPVKQMMMDPRQSSNLMDQLITEQAAARQLRTELDALKGEVVALRVENAALKAQIAHLWEIVRGQNVAASSTHDATRPIQPGNRAKHATASFNDDDVAFRDWIIRHFDGEELIVLAANAGMDRPIVAPITSMATALVQESRRLGLAERLQHEALEMRPNSPAW